MAINSTVYSPSQWQLAIKPETTAGTKNVATMQLVNIDTGVSITDAPTIFNEYRAGAGRTKKASDYFATLTVALVSPVAGNTRVYAGCVVDSITMTDDAGTDGGRRRFSVTLITKDNPSNDQSTPTSMSAYGSTYYSFWDLQAFKEVAGQAVVMNKVELTIKANAKMIGVGTDGKAEVVDRGLPGIEVSGNIGIKYDANTMSLYQDFADGDNIVIQVSDNETIGSASLGFKATTCKITGDLNPGDSDGASFIDLPFEVLAPASGNMIEIAI
jgi:hypothetical protein